MATQKPVGPVNKARAKSAQQQDSNGNRKFPLWIFPVLAVMAIGTVWLRLSIVRTSYEIDQTERMIRNLSQESDQQNLKVTALRSPRRLEEIARVKFGLTHPRADQVIHMRGSENDLTTNKEKTVLAGLTRGISAR